MIHFSRLKLNGFKSFVERTDLSIEPGLTGIVGPNGCGKSNLVEALRWVMGETSYKRMRGTGMEDVIFNGTDKRPPRSFSEVSVLLDNHARRAPALFNDQDEIEIVRRIEREQGSVYRINGKVARARDVQLLFADMMAGAHSPALVSQGKITAIINAKPIERRAILEESAGVSGLYARRHEAELRLKAADQNLVRVQDVLGNLEAQLGSLKRQARQAVKYRDLSDGIAVLDRRIAAIDYQLAGTQEERLRQDMHTHERSVADMAATVAQLNATELTQAAHLPERRKAEADAAARLQAHRITLERLGDEHARILTRLEELKRQRSGLSGDTDIARQLIEENEATLARLQNEETMVQAEIRDESARAALEEAVQKAQESVSENDAALNAALADLAARTARAEAATRARHTLTTREAQVTATRADVAARLDQERANLDKDSDLAQARLRLADSQLQLNACDDEGRIAREAVQAAENALENARALAEKADRDAARLKAEIDALAGIVNAGQDGHFRPVLEQVRAADGFEVALSRALGESLLASLSDDAPSFWKVMDRADAAAPSFPAGVQPLSPVIDVPANLKAAIGFVGWVEDDAAGSQVQPFLQPGQSVVSRAGSLWRWDGFTIKADAQDRQALYLKQKNMLADLTARLPATDQAARDAAGMRDAARETLDAARTARTVLETRLADLRRMVTDLQNNIAERERERMTASAECVKLEETLNQLDASLTQIRADLAVSDRDIQAIDHGAMSALEDGIASLRDTSARAQFTLREAMLARDRFDLEQGRLKARLQAIGDERAHLNNRTIRAREQVKSLAERDQAFHHEEQELAGRPNAIEQERVRLMDQVAVCEAARSDAARDLAVAENDVAKTVAARREAEEKLSRAREARAAAAATLEAAVEQRAHLEQQIINEFAQDAADLVKTCALDPNVDVSSAVDREKREKIIRDRDAIGPVNLRADVEARELEDQSGTLIAERDDLAQAIAELRQAIATLNSEARERLLATFASVNDNFRRLFERLFVGGRAELKLIESDDPLESGLEIMAQPPGKALQSLSLLSGGEQTLASIALIFAMFLTNPAPICVLDEIDAPLDDANVDRVCSLLEDISTQTQTRFLVITHHRMTMARMDRLYGVTMAERGVSQLVSIDLQQSFDFAEAA